MTDDVRISVGLRRHRKTKRLKKLLGADGCWALVCLFLWAGEERWTGDLAGLSDDDIETEADWDGEPGAFVAALVEVRFLVGDEGERAINDWLEHNPYASTKGQRIEKGKRAANARWSKDATSMPDACHEHAGTKSEQCPPAPAPTPTTHKQEQKQQLVPQAAPCRFDEFWAVYPNHKARKEAEKAWRKRKLDDRCDDLILHVMLMQAADDGWQRGFIPLGSTYINQDRWEDVPKRPPDSGPPQRAASQTRSAAETLLIGTSHAQQRLDQRHDSPRIGQVVELAPQRLPSR